MNFEKLVRAFMLSLIAMGLGSHVIHGCFRIYAKPILWDGGTKIFFMRSLTWLVTFFSSGTILEMGYC